MNIRDKKLKLAINRQLVDKNIAGDADLFVHGFENTEVTIAELATIVVGGAAYCPQLSKPRRNADNFLASDIVSVDIDGGMTIEQALEHPIVKQHAGLIYTTVSHTPDAHRYRIVFPTPRTVTDAREMRAAARSLALRLTGDAGAVDAARIYFGNRGARTWLLGNDLTEQLLGELIAQSINSPNMAPGQVSTSIRSALRIDPAQYVVLADGRILPFAQVGPRTSVHCPFHDDRHASAYIVTSQRGVNGLRCSTCLDTFWPIGGGDELDFLHFDQVVRRAHDDFVHHQDHGPLGPFINTPNARIGLFGCNIVITNREPAPPELLPGLILVKSPKGSGKTESLARLTAGKRRVLLIGHRRSLIRHTCARLGLNCYLDDEGLTAGDIRSRQDRYGICVDSLERIPRDSRYDVIILDESEQVLAHFLSDTIEAHRSGSRVRLFNDFAILVQRAQCVIAADADLGWISFETLGRMMDPAIPDLSQGDLFERNRPAVRLWMNDRKPGEGKTIQLFRSRDHLVADMMQTAAHGKRVFVTANSKKFIDDVAAMLAEELPAVKQLVITADTVGSEDQRALLEDAPIEALKYDAILTSPAVGTGVDVTFHDHAQLIDVVYGFCFPNITTHLDFDQQIGRVRHPGAVKVWVTPRRFQYEPSFEVVRRELLEQQVFKALLIDLNGPGRTARYVEDDKLIGMASLVISQRRVSQNALRSQFIAHKKWQGFDVGLVEPDRDLEMAGNELLKQGKLLDHARYVAAIMEATPLPSPDFDRIKEAIEGGQRVSRDEWWSYQRTRAELFYRQRVTPELVALDDHGRYRGRIKLLEAVEFTRNNLDHTHAHDQLDRRARFIRSAGAIAYAIARLLHLTPLVHQGFWDAQATVESAQLDEFVAFAQKNKAAIENLLGFEVRTDIAAKPIRQLNEVLKLIGLRVVASRTHKKDGQKHYGYRLDGDALNRIRAVQRDRAQATGWQRLAELHGWPADDDDSDVDENFDDAA